MSTSGLLVDTDVLSWIAFAKPEAKPFEPLLLDRLLFISFVTVGELYFGAEKANWGKTRVTRMEKTLKRYTVIPETFEIAKQYGSVKRAVRDQVDENDMWIAATSLAHKLAIITEVCLTLRDRLRVFQVASVGCWWWLGFVFLGAVCWYWCCVEDRTRALVRGSERTYANLGCGPICCVVCRRFRGDGRAQRR